MLSNLCRIQSPVIFVFIALSPALALARVLPHSPFPTGVAVWVDTAKARESAASAPAGYDISTLRRLSAQVPEPMVGSRSVRLFTDLTQPGVFQADPSDASKLALKLDAEGRLGKHYAMRHMGALLASPTKAALEHVRRSKGYTYSAKERALVPQDAWLVVLWRDHAGMMLAFTATTSGGVLSLRDTRPAVALKTIGGLRKGCASMGINTEVTHGDGFYQLEMKSHPMVALNVFASFAAPIFVSQRKAARQNQR